jgi:hypothetical protein
MINIRNKTLSVRITVMKKSKRIVVRIPLPGPNKVFKDKSKYTRKRKHSKHENI